MALMDLLERVRTKGKLGGINPDRGLSESLPIIYTGSSKKGVDFYSSGGKSVIFEHQGRFYRVKGVDPKGKLTTRVASSPKNKLDDVKIAKKALSYQRERKVRSLRFGEGWDKPFGVQTKEGAENARVAFERLGNYYSDRGIEPPCKFVCTHETGVQFNGEPTYQIVFELPSLDSDLRVREYDELVRERLNRCTREELKELVDPVLKLYHRIASWNGFNIRAMVECRLLPTANSFQEQNYIIFPVRDGYGVYRVDHTSTKAVDLDKDTLFDKLIGYEVMKMHSQVPTGIWLAAYPQFMKERPSEKLPTFDTGYTYTGDITLTDGYLNLNEIMKKAFILAAGYGDPKAIDAISEERLRSFLK